MAFKSLQRSFNDNKKTQTDIFKEFVKLVPSLSDDYVMSKALTEKVNDFRLNKGNEYKKNLMGYKNPKTTKNWLECDSKNYINKYIRWYHR